MIETRVQYQFQLVSVLDPGDPIPFISEWAKRQNAPNAASQRLNARNAIASIFIEKIGVVTYKI